MANHFRDKRRDKRRDKLDVAGYLKSNEGAAGYS
jgi:hypothetical protein